VDFALIEVKHDGYAMLLIGEMLQGVLHNG